MKMFQEYVASKIEMCASKQSPAVRKYGKKQIKLRVQVPFSWKVGNSGCGHIFRAHSRTTSPVIRCIESKAQIDRGHMFLLVCCEKKIEFTAKMSQISFIYPTRQCQVNLWIIKKIQYSENRIHVILTIFHTQFPFLNLHPIFVFLHRRESKHVVGWMMHSRCKTFQGLQQVYSLW